LRKPHLEFSGAILVSVVKHAVRGAAKAVGKRAAQAHARVGEVPRKEHIGLRPVQSP
jgi:hypothetical protein